MPINLGTKVESCTPCKTGIFDTSIFSALPVSLILGELLTFILEIAVNFTSEAIFNKNFTNTKIWDIIKTFLPTLLTIYFAIAIQEVGNVKAMFRIPPSLENRFSTNDINR